MLSKFHMLAAGASLGLAALAISGGTASAAPLNPPISAATSLNREVGVTQVAQRNGERRMRNDWNVRRDGDRCSRRTNNCRHFHNGYYYQTPWWTVPLIIGSAIAANNDDDEDYGNRHVEWCSDRYRSYNPRNNTWVSYSGQVNQCNSPY